MKILIAYASSGAGHHRAADAIYNYLREHFSAGELQMVDALDKATPLFRFCYRHLYVFLVRYFVFSWRFIFWLTSWPYLRCISGPINSFINRTNLKAFTDFLQKQDADLIVSTHFLPSEIIASLKNSKKISSFLITVITDFAVHPFWICEGTDCYIAASEVTKNKLIEGGVSRDKIKDIGIPIDLKFTREYNKLDLRNKIGIKKDMFTVLIMTGSFGIGPLRHIVGLLHRDTQILVVCARNQKLLSKLKNKSFRNVKVFGFVDNIEELMAVSDIIIMKPGGLTIVEALAMNLVPIFITAIPGQEENNIKILKEYQIGFRPKNMNELKEFVCELKEKPETLIAMQENINHIKRTDTLAQLYNVICQGRVRNTG